MNIVQITPGAGGMFCGNCFRDNTLVHELRKQGHSTLMVPLYLPLRLDEEDEARDTPIFFGGISVYLEQLSPLFAKAPHWLHNVLSSPLLLKWAAGRAAKTRAADLGELTISMLKGDEGNQARELVELSSWLQSNMKPDVVYLSNALLVGMARKLKRELATPVICMLQGEDSFLDSLPEEHRSRAWETLIDRAKDIDLFIGPSRYFSDLMQRRLRLPNEKVDFVYNGIHLDGFSPGENSAEGPVLGYFARMCREKGLDTLVEAFILLKKRDTIKDLTLRVGGGCGPGDLGFVEGLKRSLESAGVRQYASFHPNLDRTEKQDFYRSLSLFSVPARYGEAFGLYLLEAWASGLPVVQPRHAAFPELLLATGGGIICEPDNPAVLADGIENILTQPGRARALGEAGRQAVARAFTADAMAENILKNTRKVCDRFNAPAMAC